MGKRQKRTFHIKYKHLDIGKAKTILFHYELFAFGHRESKKRISLSNIDMQVLRIQLQTAPRNQQTHKQPYQIYAPQPTAL